MKKNKTSGIRGLVVKDLITMKKNMKSYILVAGIGVIMNLSRLNLNGSSFFSGAETGILSVLGLIIIINVLHFENESNGYRFLLGMPVTRKNIVLEKYIIGLMVPFIINLILWIILFLIRQIDIWESIDVYYIIEKIATYEGVSLMMLSVLFPATFKFGVEKARMVFGAVYIGLAFSIFLIVYSISNIIPDSLEDSIVNTLGQILTLPRYVGISIITVFIVVLYSISYLLSQRAFRNREI